MSTRIQTHIDWPAFLSRHDMLWQTKPISWDEGVFIGNGLLGAMIYSEEHRDQRHVLRFVLGRTDVTVSREGGAKAFPVRVPIGEIALEMEGWIYQPCEIRIDLWNAEMRAVIPTTKGEIRLRALIHALYPVLAIELDSDEGEQGAEMRWYSYPEVDPILKNADGINLNQYIPEITVERTEEEGTGIGVQSYGKGEGCTTAWKVHNYGRVKERKVECENDVRYRRLCLLTVVNGISSKDREIARHELENVPQEDLTSWIAEHRRWWHDYYPASFISIPDTQLESFYWIQMYKLASATRKDLLPIDNQGPWMTSTPWPGLWFNMNVQMSYSPVYTANRLELGQSLISSLRQHQEQLIRNVDESFRSDSAGLGRSSSYDLNSPVEDEVGNLTWIMHNCWRQYRYSMDEGLLRDFVYPLLRRSICLYMHLLEEGPDGRLHLPPTVSPEYGSFKQLKTPDAHYDLSLLRWGCETLLYAAKRMGIEDPLQARWADILARLTPLPVDHTGYKIGRDLSLEFGHRHFSHLLALFPLHITGNSEEERQLAIRSLRHWIAKEGDLRGFSFTGAASIAAAMGLGGEALAYLRSLMHLIKPNTMYKEAGPVIETPLAGAEAIHDMLLQSWGNIIRVFPAVPETWQEAVFHNLRAEGGFLVSAASKAGQTAFIRIQSLAGEPCRLLTDLAYSEKGFVIEVQGKRVHYILHEDRSIEIMLKSGDEAVLYAADGEEPRVIAPVPAEPGMQHFFGSRKPWRLYGLPK
ncbi:glycosyl hydrolase family 95 catalytic domain-containing protein [Paenibacillus sp. VMFN-D1]|uniref:glycosyl hydrolase family 95 catalytic domain-containing protein n=1 Tax=Paenibacillus sp. VMFN-D1 TaxID=2135608 RepID=UPI000E2711D8|nr:hypothetical protein [Paenibacillus sp. VMFN-D1]RED40161.1 hypothetical protein C7820_1308 [Paenibacillus sp. VMFN-D1]